MVVLEKRPKRKVLRLNGHMSEALNALTGCSFKKQNRHQFYPPPCELTARRWPSVTFKKVLIRPDHTGTLSSDLQPAELGDISTLKSPSLRYLDVAAPAD